MPVTDRIQYLFKFKQLLEANIDDMARTITNECGKTFKEAVAEMRRGVENVEVRVRRPVADLGLQQRRHRQRD